MIYKLNGFHHIDEILSISLAYLFIAAVAALNAEGSEQTKIETGKPFFPGRVLPVDDVPDAPPGTDVPRNM